MEVPFDLSKSMWGDMVSQCGGDQEKARAMWTGVAQEEDRAEKDRKIRTLQSNFPLLPKELVEAKLEENGWDVDATILPLWQALEERKEAERKEKRAAEDLERVALREQRRKEANAQARNFLQNLFDQIPGDQIQAMLDKNEGDVEATTEQLLQISREEKEAKEKEAREKEAKNKAQQEQELVRKQRELEKQLKFDTVKRTFAEYVAEEEIADSLAKHNWDMKEVTRSLLNITEARKQEQLQRLFGALNDEQIRNALQESDWNMGKAMAQLRELQSALRRSAEKVKVEQPKVEVVVKPQLEASLPPVAVEEPVVPPVLVSSGNSKDVEAFMHRSAILEKELTDLIEIHKEEAKAQEPETIFKQMLEDKLRFGPDAIPGLPGMVPLTPKLIDQLQNRKPFESQILERPLVAQELPDEKSDEGVLIAGNDAHITLNITTARADIGQKITVEWDSQSETTTSDWIGMYRAGSAVSQYITWNWIGKAVKRGSLTFTATEFGQFKFCYFRKSRSNLLASSGIIEVGPSYTLEATQVGDAKKISVKFAKQTGNEYPNAWIGIYDIKQTDNRQYITYEWIASAVDSRLTYDVPKTGHYEFRLFPQKSYVDVARTSINLQGQDVLKMSLDGETLSIACKIQTVDCAAESAWVGLYLAGEPDQRQYRRYKYVSSAASVADAQTGVQVVTFVAPRLASAGRYEARLFANGSLAPTCVSNVVEVPSA